jgi:hypothetical protein
MPSTVVDEIGTRPRDHHHRPSPNPVVAVLVTGCAYEVTASAVNTWIGEPTLPLLSNAVSAFTWRAFGRRLRPPWIVPAGLVGVGFVLTVAVVGPRRRRKWAKKVKKQVKKAVTPPQ